MARETFIWLVSGPFGSGKTLMALSYFPREIPQPRRLVIDAEIRAMRYQSETHGVQGDHPEKLLYSFGFYPSADEDISQKTFIDLINRLRGLMPWEPLEKPDVLIFDNFALFQEAIEGWLMDVNNAEKILRACNLLDAYSSLLKSRFKPPDSAWWNLVKATLREMFRFAKRAGVDVFITSELRNEWENFGVSGRGKDGKPLMRIKGQTAKVLSPVLQMGDINWILERNAGVLSAKPTVSLDPLVPKCSIVGLPPKFPFTDWNEIWRWEQERNVITPEQMAQIVLPDPKFQAGEVSEEAEEELRAEEEAKLARQKLKEGKRKLVDTLLATGLYADQDAIVEAIKATRIPYTLEDHDKILALLSQPKGEDTPPWKEENGEKVA